MWCIVCESFHIQEKVQWVAAITDSPKPPPTRITLTIPVLLNAKFAVFAACGAGKADMVKVRLHRSFIS